MRANKVMGYMPSKCAWVVLGVYHQIFIVLEPTRQGALLVGPTLRLLLSTSGKRKKQYLPADKFGEDVGLAANCMLAYCEKILDRVEQPVADISRAVPSLPVTCCICGDGFLHDGALFKNIIPRNVVTTWSIAKYCPYRFFV